jgi:hypothetical protein
MLQEMNNDLLCGCQIRHNQVIHRCEKATLLFQEIKLASKNGSPGKLERANFNYEEHYTEQFERIELD